MFFPLTTRQPQSLCRHDADDTQHAAASSSPNSTGQMRLGQGRSLRRDTVGHSHRADQRASVQNAAFHRRKREILHWPAQHRGVGVCPQGAPGREETERGQSGQQRPSTRPRGRPKCESRSRFSPRRLPLVVLCWRPPPSSALTSAVVRREFRPRGEDDISIVVSPLLCSLLRSLLRLFLAVYFLPTIVQVAAQEERIERS